VDFIKVDALPIHFTEYLRNERMITNFTVRLRHLLRNISLDSVSITHRFHSTTSGRTLI